MCLSDRFWSKVEKTPTCWLWTATKSKKQRRGLFRLNGSMQWAPRVSWEITNGSIPVGLCVLHSCDNPTCVNPNHLWLGTQKDNIQDMQQKGRERKVTGAAHHAAKLDEVKIKEIFKLRREGWTQERIAKLFSVSQPVVSEVLLRKIWKQVSL